MTVLCAIHIDGQTHIASDSRVRCGEIAIDHQPKWVVADNGSWAIGVAGMSRAMNLIEDMKGCFKAGDKPLSVAGLIIDRLKADGWSLRSDPGEPQRYAVSFIWATVDGVWAIACDGSVLPYPEGALCVDGSGGAEAFGAWFALSGSGVGPMACLGMAVRAAMARDAMCGGDVFYAILDDSSRKVRGGS